MSNLNVFRFLAAALAGWVNGHQQAIIDHLVEENGIFKQQLLGRRPHLSDDDRRRLAAKAKALGRQVLDEVANLVTPATLLAWYRNHKGVRNQPLGPSNVVAFSIEPVQRRERLGGKLNFYHREAA